MSGLLAPRPVLSRAGLSALHAVGRGVFSLAGIASRRCPGRLSCAPSQLRSLSCWEWGEMVREEGVRAWTPRPYPALTAQGRMLQRDPG